MVLKPANKTVILWFLCLSSTIRANRQLVGWLDFIYAKTCFRNDLRLDLLTNQHTTMGALSKHCYCLDARQKLWFPYKRKKLTVSHTSLMLRFTITKQLNDVFNLALSRSLIVNTSLSLLSRVCSLIKNMLLQTFAKSTFSRYASSLLLNSGRTQTMFSVAWHDNICAESKNVKVEDIKNVKSPGRYNC